MIEVPLSETHKWMDARNGLQRMHLLGATHTLAPVVALSAQILTPCTDSSPVRNSAPLGPYSRTVPRALWKPYGGELFLMSEVPL